MGKRVLGVMVVALMLALTGVAQAVAITWDGGTANWNANHWGGGNPPAGGSNYVIGGGGAADGTAGAPSSSRNFPGDDLELLSGGELVWANYANYNITLSDTLTLSGGKISVDPGGNTRSLTPAGGFVTTVATDTEIAVTGSDHALSVVGQFTGAGSITKTGPRPLTLEKGTHTLSGMITVEGGSLSVSLDNAEPCPNLTKYVVNGGTLTAGRHTNFSRPIEIGANGGTIYAHTGNAYLAKINGNLSGPGLLTLTGRSQFEVNGTANVNSGGVVLNRTYTTTVGATSSLGTGDVSVLQNTLILKGDSNLAAGAELSVAGGATVRISSDVDIIVQTLTIAGSPIASGVYDQGNPLSGVTFDNSGSSLEVTGLPPIPEPAGLALIGFALLGLRRRRRNQGAERRHAMGKRVLGVMALGIALALAGMVQAAPTNSVFNPGDYTSLGALSPTTDLTFNTTTLAWTVDSVVQGSSGVTATSQGGGVEAAVFAFDSVSLDGLGTNVTVTGHRALVVASQSTALIKNTTIDISGKQGDPVGGGTINGGAGGPGAEGGSAIGGTYDSVAATIRGDGGYGQSGGALSGPGVGYGGGYLTIKQNANGGGYGGHGGEGRYAPSTGGATYGDDLLTELYGGSGGSGSAYNSGTVGGGGGGGGAFELVAMDTLTLEGDSILANGGNASSPTTNVTKAGGGGSGGGIILAAPDILLVGANTVSANGGRGGKAGNGTQGGGGGGGGRIALYRNDLLGDTSGITALKGGEWGVDVAAAGGTVNLAAGSFGAVPIPEPASLGLIGLALAGLPRRRR